VLYSSEIGQNRNGAVKNIDSKCNTHILGLAYSFINTLNIVEIASEKFLAIPKFGFLASSSAIVAIVWSNEKVGGYCTKVVL
jgi:hypothetical protein